MIIRELFAKLGLDVNAQSFAKGEIAVELIKKGVEKLVEFGKEAIEKVEEIAESGHRIKQLAAQTGTSADQFQNLARAANLSNVSTDSMAHSLTLLSRQLYAAKTGNEEARKGFKRMGVDIKDAHGNLRSAGDVLLDISDYFSKLPDGAEKSALAMKYLGRSGAEMNDFLNRGRETIKELGEGYNLTPEQIKASEEFVETQKRLSQVTQGLWKRAIAPLIPAITELLKRYLAWRKANAGVMAQNITKYVGYVISAIKALGSWIGFLIKNFKAVEIIVGVGLVIAFSRIETAALKAAAATVRAWLAAAAPFLAIAAVIAGFLLIFDDLREYQQELKDPAHHKSLFGKFKKQLDDWLKPNAKDPWWLTVVKDFVRVLRDAVELLNEFDAATNRFAPTNVDKGAAVGKKESDRRADNMTLAAARARVAKGLNLTPEEMGAITRSGLSPEAFISRYQPAEPSVPGMLAAPGGGGSSSVTVNVYAAPGMSEEQVGKIAADKVQEAHERHNESAAAAIPAE